MTEHELAEWCREQTIAYYNGLLSEEHIKKLESLPYWSWTKYLTKKEIELFGADK